MEAPSPKDPGRARSELAPIAPERLRRVCDPATFTFQTTEDLEPLAGFVGQKRALDAITFGTEIERPGFHLFVLGTPATGRHTAVAEYLGALATTKEAPPDWVYVNNFDTPHKPKALKLPTGRAIAFRDALAAAIDELATSLPAVLDSDEYRRRRRAIDDAFEQSHEQAFASLRKAAREQGIGVLRTPMGFALVPTRDGEAIPPERFNAWPVEERRKVEQAMERLQEEFRAVLERLPRLEKERREKVRALDREFAAMAVGQALDETLRTLEDLPDVVDHIERVRADLVDNAGRFVAARNGDEAQAGGGDALSRRRYAVNVVVSRDRPEAGAPVVREDNPTLPNLVGRIEHLQQMGTLVTDFTLIKPGALHRANGGYLMIDARKVLAEPLAWEALKRALRNGRLVFESLADHFSLVSTVSLEPEAIPFSAKVVLFGPRLLYYLLCEFDPDFPDIFKVAVDFDDVMPNEESAPTTFARLLAAIVKREKLLHFDRTAIARMIEHAGRLAEDTERLSLRIGLIADLAREADHWARSARTERVSADHVERAEREHRRRLDRLREKSREAVDRGIQLLDTDGAKVGQANGLSVLSLGAYAFGRPTRISARVRLGAGRVVDIEREVELGGPVHSKGVLILSSFLSANYALDWPVSLAASLVFEQSYGGVEGDSASVAELCALLSAIADVPLRQDLALTGSVNQFGEVQSIGGVNEKIESFFEVCRDRGLTGSQGVIVPLANVQHLMLRDDVVEACRTGQFAVHAMRHVDEAMALLTGRVPGERGPDGRFPAGTLNHLIDERLIELAKRRRAIGPRGDQPLDCDR